MAEKLDIDQELIYKDASGLLRATPYFEDYLFNLIEAVGGEGSTSSVDAFDLANLNQAIIGLPEKVNELKKYTENLEQQINIPYLIAKIESLRKEVENLQKIEPSKLMSKLSNQDKRIDDLEQYIASLRIKK